MTDPVQLDPEDVSDFSQHIGSAMAGVPDPGQLQDEAIAFKQVPLPAAPGLTNLDAPTRLQAALVKFTDALKDYHAGAKNSQAFYTQFAAEVARIFPDIDHKSAADFNNLVLPTVSKHIPSPNGRTNG